jgi:hypothetical protein
MGIKRLGRATDPCKDCHVAARQVSPIGKVYAYCTDCKNARGRQRDYQAYDQRRKPYLMQWKRNKHDSLRRAAISLVGGRCVVCFEDDIDVLEIDHKNGRKGDPYTAGSGTFLAAIISGKRGVDDLQVLCANDHVRITRMRKRGISDVFSGSRY